MTRVSRKWFPSGFIYLKKNYLHNNKNLFFNLKQIRLRDGGQFPWFGWCVLRYYQSRWDPIVECYSCKVVVLSPGQDHHILGLLKCCYCLCPNQPLMSVVNKWVKSIHPWKGNQSCLPQLQCVIMTIMEHVLGFYQLHFALWSFPHTVYTGKPETILGRSMVDSNNIVTEYIKI